MKKCASGIFFWINILSSFLLFILCIWVFLYYFFYPFVNSKYPLIFVVLILLIPLFISALSIFRFAKCYYYINKREIEISMFVVKRKKKSYDLLKYSHHTYKGICQNERHKFNVDDVVSIGLLDDLNIKRSYYKNDDIGIVLSNNKKILIKNGLYSKSQIVEITKAIKKNKKVIIGEKLKEKYTI